MVVEEKYNWLKGASFTYRKLTNYLVIHHAAHTNCTAQDVHRWHLNRGWTGIGYHYFISKLGVIFRGRPKNVVGAHAIGFNLNSIGVCLEGNFEVEKPTKDQYVSLGKLVKVIKGEYKGIKVVTHKDLNPTVCPGKNFNMDEIIIPTEIEILEIEKTKVTYQSLDGKNIPLDAYLINNGITNKTYVEARKIFEQIGLKVVWNKEGTVIKR